MITDSGLGGLAVCAGIEERLRDAQVDLELLYVNANPAADGGYNSLASQGDRIAMFDRFLKGSSLIYEPDRIAIACNTLSVIYNDTEFSRETRVPVDGIVDAAVQMSRSHLSENPEHGLIVFATETTTEAGTYPRLIQAEKGLLVAQACPDLASAITSDASGAACHALLNEYARVALDNFDERPGTVASLLACTHYGYQSNIFSQVLRDQGVKSITLDPNALMVEQLIAGLNDFRLTGSDALRVRFISRFPIPEVEIDSVQTYLNDRAPLTLAALENHEIQPNLFLNK
ncbi:MAG: aspartate/glutamate racemase family protein [Candidatus Marinimicrobia bacterium]|nr:aspartate/glutamate racemase family protein [Candidatus Neomarinimicrobiota bacterium]MCF7851337.1 aspartate/glutamate racemase family protein [Candidatus Neomarinimicrobiota bacterium]MCF7904328.1 aspartate/glutamate racemase family protein [Candidatus Neomarinimicrobiota bacterium]